MGRDLPGWMLHLVKSGSSYLEFLHFWQFPKPFLPRMLSFIAPEGKLRNKCFPEGGKSYLEEAGLCQISKNFYKTPGLELREKVFKSKC